MQQFPNSLTVISKLEPHEVFVFGSNDSGFHGAGAAGMAFSGTPVNDWRTCPRKQAAIAAFRNLGTRPWPNPGIDPRVGNWTRWGIAEGFSVGTIGKSYAIRTVHRPGGPKVALEEIARQFRDLFVYCRLHPELNFLFTEVGCGLAGHCPSDLRAILDGVIREAGAIPPNLLRTETAYQR